MVSKTWPGYGFMMLASFCFSLMGLSVRMSKPFFDLPQLILWRGTVIIILLLPWAIKNRKAVLGGNRKLLLFRGLSGSLAVFLFFYALQTIPIGLATVLNQTSPLFAVLLVWGLFAVAPKPINLVAIFGGIFGVSLLFGPQVSDHSLGILAGLGSGVCAASAYICIRRLRFSDGPNVILLWFAAISILTMFPFALKPWTLEPLAWFWSTCAGVTALLGQYFLIRSLFYLTATAGSTSGLVGSVFSALWGILVFGEMLLPGQWLGMLILLLSTMLPAFFVGNRVVATQPRPFRWQKARES